jgi:hypothetical protein
VAISPAYGNVENLGKYESNENIESGIETKISVAAKIWISWLAKMTAKKKRKAVWRSRSGGVSAKLSAGENVAKWRQSAKAAKMAKAGGKLKANQ